MKISMTDLLYATSFALDSVEAEMLNASTYHSKRVAYLSVLMGRRLGWTDEQLTDIACCSILHDNALTEYAKVELGKGNDIKSDLDRQMAEAEDKNLVTPINFGAHCTLGERNISRMPFHGRVENVILYHHENADGSGPFGLSSVDTPLPAQIIHLNDIVDVIYNLNTVDEAKFGKINGFLDRYSDVLFAPGMVSLFKKAITYEDLRSIRGEHVEQMLHMAIPEVVYEYSNEEMMGLASIFARITDYKSSFTRRHSEGIAEKARDMGHYYGMGDFVSAKLYLTGALHDIGKLIVDNDVLEKPARLTDREFQYVQTHAWHTFDVLRRIRGFEDITQWAALHHEKLDGSGYPFGKQGFELSKVERLIACIDIYQALIEDRPYKVGMPHEKAISIMRDMAATGKIDGPIVEDIDDCFRNREVA